MTAKGIRQRQRRCVYCGERATALRDLPPWLREAECHAPPTCPVHRDLPALDPHYALAAERA